MNTVVYTIYPSSPNEKTLEEVAFALAQGALMIYPTDTVYALGCLSDNAKALSKFEQLRGIKVAKAPLSFLFASIGDISNYIKPFDSSVFRLLKRTLPGPYAFIMEATTRLPKPFQKRKSIGVRISANPILQALLPRLSSPLITASLHDKDALRVYPSDPEEILAQWDGMVDVFIDGGQGGNIPSTVVDLTQSPYTLIREGKGSVDVL